MPTAAIGIGIMYPGQPKSCRMKLSQKYVSAPRSLERKLSTVTRETTRSTIPKMSSLVSSDRSGSSAAFRTVAAEAFFAAR
jgi:hypothetical protein